MPSARPVQKVVEFVTPEALQPKVKILEDRITALRGELVVLNTAKTLKSAIEEMKAELDRVTGEIDVQRDRIQRMLADAQTEIAETRRQVEADISRKLEVIAAQWAEAERDRKGLGDREAACVLRESELDAREVRLGRLKVDLDTMSDRLLTWQDDLREVGGKTNAKYDEATQILEAAATRDADADRKLAIVAEKEEELKGWTTELSAIQKQNDRDARSIADRRAALDRDLAILASDRQMVEGLREELNQKSTETETTWKKAEQQAHRNRQKERELKEAGQLQERREADLIKLEGRLREEKRLIDGARDHLVKKAAKDAEGS